MTGNALQDSIRTLLDTLGQDVTFRRVTEGTYDPATGQTGSATTDDETARVAFVNYRDELRDGQNIQMGDRKALMSATASDGSALSKTPKLQDQLVGQGDTVKVVAVKTIRAGDVLTGWELQVRE